MRRVKKGEVQYEVTFPYVFKPWISFHLHYHTSAVMVSFGRDAISPALQPRTMGTRSLRLSHVKNGLKKDSSKVQHLDVTPAGWAAPLCLPYQSAFVPAIGRAANLHDGCCVPAAIQCNEPLLASCFHRISIMQMQPQPVTLLLLSSTYSQHTASAAALHTRFQIPTCFFYIWLTLK